MPPAGCRREEGGSAGWPGVPEEDSQQEKGQEVRSGKSGQDQSLQSKGGGFGGSGEKG